MTEDIYPKYRVVKTYDGYKVQKCAYSPEERMRTARFLAEWDDTSYTTYRWKWQAILDARSRIDIDRKGRERRVYEESVAWGPAP